MDNRVIGPHLVRSLSMSVFLIGSRIGLANATSEVRECLQVVG